MYDIDICYKMIFEAMLGENVLWDIADKIGNYTNAGILFVSGFGRILAYSCAEEKYHLESVGRGHLTLRDYENVQTYVRKNGYYRMTKAVETEKKNSGYISVLYERAADQSFFEMLLEILTKAVRSYFEKEQKKYQCSQSLKANITGWTIFEGTEEEQESLSRQIEGQYLVVCLLKKELEKVSVTEFSGIWRNLYFYETEKEVVILYYQLKEENVEAIQKALEERKIHCCVSELFTKLALCKNKKKLLDRMGSIGCPSEENNGVRLEKDWAVKGIYTYTLPLMEIAGLQDYAITELIHKDQENNTELYETLKVYLLCENNVTTAAKQLHIHRNTMVYRLKQIKNIMKVDFNENEKARELLAYMMMHERTV